MSKLSNIEANLELINLAKSISCLDEFSDQFNILVSSGCLTSVFSATVDTIVFLDSVDNVYEKCMIISDKFNECYIIYSESCSDVEDMIKHILNKNIKQDVLQLLLVRFMYISNNIYPTEIINVIDHDKLYLMFIEYSFYTISHKYEQIYLYFKNNKVDIDKYNDIVVDNIICKGNNNLVNLDIFNFTSEQLYKLNLYECLNTRNALHQTMIDNKFDYNVVKHIFDTNHDYTPNSFIYDDVMVYCSSIKIRKICKLLMSHGCFPQYINIVKYVSRYSIDISLETLNTDDLNRNNYYKLKILINIVVASVKPDDKKIYIPKYRNNIVLPVKRYFNDDSYVNINILLASIIGHEYDRMKVKDFRDIVKQKYEHYINSISVYMHIDYVYLMNDYTYIKTDNFIDHVLDKYLP